MFCPVDIGLTGEKNIEVNIAEGAEIGLDKLREQLQQEFAEEAENEGQNEDFEEKKGGGD